MNNATIAQKLTEYATYLEAREASVYRVRAYRQAAQTVLGLERPLTEILAGEGRRGLEALPGIGSPRAFTLEGRGPTRERRTIGGDGRPQAPHPPPTRAD